MGIGVILSSLSRRGWLLWPALAVFFIALSVSYYRKVADEPKGFRSAIYRWQNQLRDLADGEDIWDKHHYPNPPILALLLMPLAQLPEQVGAMSWFFLKCALATLALHWIFRMLETGVAGAESSKPRHLCNFRHRSVEDCAPATRESHCKPFPL